MKKWLVTKWTSTEVKADTEEDAVELGMEELEETRSPDEFEYKAEPVVGSKKQKNLPNPEVFEDLREGKLEGWKGPWWFL